MPRPRRWVESPKLPRVSVSAAADAVTKALEDAEEHAHVTIKDRQIGSANAPVKATGDSVTVTYQGKDYVLEKLKSPGYAHAAEHPVLVLRLPEQPARYYQWYDNYWRRIEEAQLADDPADLFGDEDVVAAWTHALIAAFPRRPG
jgi:hypothetical protein